MKNDVKRLIKRGRIIKDDFSTIRNILDNIISSFPPDWEPIKYKNVIIEILASRMKSKSIFNPTEKCGCII